MTKTEGGAIAKPKKKSQKHKKPQLDLHRKKLWFDLSSEQKNWIALAIFIVLAFVFFHEVLFGDKTFISPDAKSPTALSKPLSKVLWEGHSYPQWMPYIFGGMPSFGSLMYTPFVYFPDFFWALVKKLFTLPVLFSHIIHYPLAGIGVLLFLRSKGINFWGQLLGGITFMFTPYLITMEVFGHGSQIMTAAYIPLAIWAVDQLLQKGNFLYLGIAALLIGLQLQRGHVQIIYYTWMAIGLYAIYFMIRSRWIQNNMRGVPKSLGYLTGALILGFGLAAVLYFSIYEYTPYSIRGGAGVNGGGVGFDYATQWSFHPKEMLTFLVPSFFGFGGQTYWGPMPFTDYPNYMGILPLMLAIFAFVHKRRETAWYFAALILVSLMISFGRHFSSFYNLLYSYLPFFNKFRVPVMILILVQFSVAVLAGMGLQNLMDLTKQGINILKNKKSVYLQILKISTMVVAVFAGIVLLGAIFSDAFFNFMSRLYPVQYEPNIQQQLNKIRFDMLIKDMWIMIFFLGLGLSLLWLLLKKKMRPGYFGLLIGLLTVVDLWIVDFKLNKPVPERAMDEYLAADETINFLKQDKNLFRILPLGPLFGENRWAAHEIASIGGYHAAKLRLYQDFMDALNLPNSFAVKYYKVSRVSGQERFEPLPADQLPKKERQVHLTALNLFNVKYVVAPFPIPEPDFELANTTQMSLRGQPNNIFIYENKNVLPRAYFVGKVQVVANQNAVMEVLKSGELDPSEMAILEESPEIFPQENGEGSVVVTDYDTHKINLRCDTEAPKLLVLSEVYYPKGWKAFIDGQPTKIYKTNYLFRSVVVPAGSHEVKFSFESTAFKAGMAVSGIGWLIVLTILGFGIRQSRKRKSPRSQQN